MEQREPPVFPESNRKSEPCPACIYPYSWVVQNRRGTERNPCGKCGWLATVENFTDAELACPYNAGLSLTETRHLIEFSGLKMLARYRLSTKDTRSRLRSLYIDGDVNWPSTGDFNWACPCCGYHSFWSIQDADQTCTVCSLQRNFPVQYESDTWNMDSWKCAFHEYPYAHPLRIGSIDRARKAFETRGYVSFQYTRARPPQDKELPRHDWASDPRVFRDPDWRSLDPSNRDDLDL